MNSSFEHHIKKQLSRYRAQGLEDLEDASLMNRVDTKFVLPLAMVPELLGVLQKDFAALEINGERIFRYENIYYDTPHFLFYNMHHQGRLNRHKVRVRKYLDSNTRFLEVKFKNNKRRTIKNRVELPENYAEDLKEYLGFLSDTDVPKAKELVPCQRSRYQRIALVSPTRCERLTIDIGLRHKMLSGNNSAKTYMDDIAIVELKQKKVCRASPFFVFMKKKGIRQSSISKYCVGLMMASMKNGMLKYNRFKGVARRVAKLGKSENPVS